LRGGTATAAAAEERIDSGMGSWVRNFEEVERASGWTLKLEGVREWGFGFGRREEKGAMVVVVVAAAVTAMLNIVASFSSSYLLMGLIQK